MSVSTFIAAACIIPIIAVYFFGAKVKDLRGRAYILNNSTTHVRYLPIEAQHSFTYPMVSLLLSVKDLEYSRLDLGRSFAYSPKHWALTSIDPQAYFQDALALANVSLSEKLDMLLRERGMVAVAEKIGDSWMMTMPNYLGFGATNPLTVYFCYDKESSELVLLVLEVECILLPPILGYLISLSQVHNTFEERHIYLLKPGVDEDESKSKGCAGFGVISGSTNVTSYSVFIADTQILGRFLVHFTSRPSTTAVAHTPALSSHPCIRPVTRTGRPPIPLLIQYHHHHRQRLALLSDYSSSHPPDRRNSPPLSGHNAPSPCPQRDGWQL